MTKMKMGMRKPSIKKSIKARTTGKVKRSIKRSVNPLYGKKGMGLINIGVSDIIKQAGSSADIPAVEESGSGPGLFIFLIVICSALAILGLLVALVIPVAGIAAIAFGIFGIVYSVKRIRKQ